MAKYSVIVKIENLDEAGSESSTIHVGNIETKSMDALVKHASKLLDSFGHKDAVAEHNRLVETQNANAAANKPA